MSWAITKEFSFCFGHRVHNQELDVEFAGDGPCKCRHLHGHEGKLEVTLELSPGKTELTRGMVTDFHSLNWLKKFIDDTLDHRFIIDRDDPLFDQLVGGAIGAGPHGLELYLETNLLWRTDSQGAKEGRGSCWELNSGKISERTDMSKAQKEFAESFVIVNFVPTSENFSKWIFELIQWKMHRLCAVKQVKWWESPKSNSCYVNPNL